MSQLDVRHSVDEQELRHLRVLELGLLVELHDHRDVNRQNHRRHDLLLDLWRRHPAPGTRYRGISDAMERNSALVRVERSHWGPRTRPSPAIAVRCLASTSRAWSRRCPAACSSTGCTRAAALELQASATTGVLSAICSMVCRSTHSCGPRTPADSRSGHEPAAGGSSSSSSREKCCTPAARGGGCARNVAVKCIS